MSLLLDALKKAEADKKKSANVQDDAPPVEEAVDADEDSLELELNLEQPESAEIDKLQEDFPHVDESAIYTSDTEQAPASPIADNLNSVEPSEIPVQVSSDAAPGIAEESEKPVSTEDEYNPQDRTAVETTETESDQSSTQQPDAPAQPVPHEAPTASANSDQDTPDSPATQAISGSPADITISAETQQPAQQAELDKIEKEKALSALINKTNQYDNKQRLRQRILIAVIIILVLFGSAIYYYLEMMTSTQDLYLAQQHPEAVSRSITPPVTPSQQATTPAVSQPIESKPAINKAVTPSTSPAEPRRTTQKAAPTQTAKAKPASAPEQILTIEHSRKPDPINQLLIDAYNAFHRGDYTQSKRLYAEVLDREPRNRDAILGMAANAIRQQRYDEARARYQSLLKLDPRDTMATAGLSNLNTLVNAGMNESQLKFMIRQQPDASHLHFALGNIFARQQRWPEAQSAYFSAWSSSSKNADYAYNLAISLDHLNKPVQAIEYYALSLKLHAASGGNFSPPTISKRIQDLKEHSQ